MTEINLIAADDLITELLNRFDHAVFMGIKCMGGENNEIRSARRWQGNSFTDCGLCDSLKRQILEEYDKKEKPIEANDI